MLHRIGGDVDAALEELRSLAAGVYPSLLAARGLHDAIRTAALQSPLPTSVDVDGSDRYADEIETAAYFCCIEALQNVSKHAPDAELRRDLRSAATETFGSRCATTARVSRSARSRRATAS